MCDVCGCGPCVACGALIEDGLCSGCGEKPENCTCELLEEELDYEDEPDEEEEDEEEDDDYDDDDDDDYDDEDDDRDW
jgi:hypothetical protein